MDKKTKETITLVAEITILAVLIFMYVHFFMIPHTSNKEVPTEAPTLTATVAPTATPTPSPTLTPTVTPTISPTPTPSPSPTPTPTPAASPVSYGYGKGKPGYYKCETNGTHGFKIGTDYRAYTNKSSMQYKLMFSGASRTDERTGIRIATDPYGVDRYLVALGTAWAGGSPSDIGRCIDIYMVNGATLHCVLGDVKKVEDTINRESPASRRILCGFSQVRFATC